MDLSRFRLLLAPAFAALFMLLSLCIFLVQSPPSMGFRVPLLRLRHQVHPTCDGDWEFVELLDDGTTRINGNQIRQENLALHVSNNMATKAERLIYVVPSSGIPYSRLLETMSTLKQAVPDMHIDVLLSGEVRDAYRRPFLKRIDLPCDIEWQARDF